MHARLTTSSRSRALVASAPPLREPSETIAGSSTRNATPTFPSDLATPMAKNQQGPRQPLSQRRPKVAVGKKNAVQRPGRKAATLPKAKAGPKSKRGPRLARRPAPDPGVVYDQLLALYPDAHCELDFKTPFQLLVATILSAQCTDKRVNMVTPALFARFPDAEKMSVANP